MVKVHITSIQILRAIELECLTSTKVTFGLGGREGPEGDCDFSMVLTLHRLKLCTLGLVKYNICF
jgi:hypothetical protein